MPTKKILLAAVLGGIVMFAWGALSHIAIPFYNSTLLQFSNEDAITQTILANAPKSGVYFLPYETQLPASASEQERKAAEEKMMNQMSHGPFMLASIRVGEMGPIWRYLLVELLSNMLSALLVAILLLKIKPMSIMNKLLFIQGVLLTVFFSINISYWNWYAFSTGFTLAELFDQVVGWLLAGWVIIKNSTRRDAGCNIVMICCLL